LLNWIVDQQALQADGSQGLLVSEPATDQSKPLRTASYTPDSVRGGPL
jgi:hypothetical protein